ncbi:TPA: S8 family peptidase [Vibrio cholerae]|uniref:S8 family peptidase n=1 Tax=Vibrio cholerae TaxID=666 RepID=UPI001F375F83|nr:S8 family peptidase [Vibrio cholerae]UIP03523.1 S8 family peptidase [Vibrio cholerae]HEQ3433958.1 S8 family peptidase [Vibrio cholerae]HEQ3494944.1 S8 family peptidase [Vibrio cholerae]HEQ3506699.1 S8 family peptidase [Vibrio cholerae]HEQ3571378.1 S8 family peptidase [Vibrio cholerae]
MANYEHLKIERELLENERRTRKINIPRHPRGDLRGHGQKLSRDLTESFKFAQSQQTSRPGNFVLKIRYTGLLDITHLNKHGIEFVSQEDNHLCVVFVDETGMAVFADHLQRLGLDDAELTYKQILEAIEGIDNWTSEDRKSWALRRNGLPRSEKFLLDVELWPVAVAYHPERLSTCDAFERWLVHNGIRRIDKVNLDSLIMYRLEVNSSQANVLLNHSDVRLVDLPPKSGIHYSQLNCDIDRIPEGILSPTHQAARVCVLDSGVNTNHPLLAPAIAESEDFIGDTGGMDLNGHGTAVAGVALYGDLEACNSTNYWHPELWIFNGRILDENAEFDSSSIEKTLIEAVTYFVEEHQCRIFNLSLGNSNAPYDNRHIRGIAYVLDKLARDFNILFVVSAGNFSGSIGPDVPRHSWRDEYPEYLLADESIIIDPAPALNVLTVGSLARHNATFDAQRYPEIGQLAPATENQPSPFTRHGPTIKGAIKPELVAMGGNLASPIRTGNELNAVMRGMGVLTCNSRFVGNTLFSEISGTSFAAPYITHLAGRLLNNYPKASANLLRALLVNHANMLSEIESSFPEDMKKSYRSANGRDAFRDIAGYGAVDEGELFRSSQNAVVLMAEEKIENNSHHFFELPLPDDFLRSQRASREIRVTLSYCPAVRTTRIDYVATKMSFRLVKDQSLESVQRHFNHSTQDETKTRNDDATSNRDISAELRGKGTVQSSTWRIKQPKPSEKWFVVITRQDRDWGEALSFEQEDYALVVTVTDRENEEAQLYSQISQRIELKARERARARV